MRTSPLVVALLLGLLAQPAVAAEPAAEAVDVAAEPAAEATDAAKASTPATPDPVLGAPRPPEIPLEDIRTFTAVFRAVQDAYVEPVDDHTLMQSAIRGLLAGLDPHSEFLDTRGLGELDEQATGEYAGLGVEVLFMEGVLRVIAPIDDTPAQRAGIKPGDIILRIDGELIGADEGDRAVERLRGKAGSQTTLSVLREGLDVPLEITLRRERIKVASVRARSLEPGYAYVRISQFQQETGAELRRKLRQISGNGRIKGTVL
ncbi:MAG: PDZ domain-containing protein, partial [Xanthomonadales bacterium]|nr:PDZ domain-containing protein [Xanthomonadales bacterium]